MGAPKANQKYTYKDYLTWDDDRRWELIDGVPYELVFGEDPQNMSPAPGRKHQRISGNLYRLIGNFLVDKSCDVYNAPFDVRFNEADDTNTVVQPDISVFCDKSKLDDAGGHGTPDFIIEILSPSTTLRDLSVKLLLYQRHGVPEYWVVDPDKQIIYVYLLNEQGKYDIPHEYKSGKIHVQVIKGLELGWEEIFAE